MKKILTFLIALVYITTSFIAIKYFKINELNDIRYKNCTEILVTDWQKDSKIEEKLLDIDKLAKNQNLNIYKFVYKPKVESKNQTIIIYSAIGNKVDFENKFKLSKVDYFLDNDSNEKFISNEIIDNSNQIGKLALFGQDYLIEIRPLSASNQENIRGTYLIQSNDLNKIKVIESELTSLGLDISSKENTEVSLSVWDIMDKDVIIILVILFTLILLCLFYYILLKYKELAIKKLFGFSNKNLIFKQLTTDILKMYFFSFIISTLIFLIYIYTYNKFGNIFNFLKLCIVFNLIITAIGVIISLLSVFIIYFIDISQMLKNRKPMKLMQILNYSAKLIFSTCLLLILINLLNNYKALIIQNPNKQKWEITKNYAFYEYKVSLSQESIQKTEYDLGIKSKELFKFNNSKGAILISPSTKIIVESYGGIINENEYDPENGNNIIINSNYLKENPIYDSNNKKVEIESDYEDEDYLIILVPNKYKKNEKEISDIYKSWYQFKRYIDEDINNERNGLEKINHDEVKIEIRYIQDYQKTFLYNPNLNRTNNNYSINSILIIANSENMGGDSYLNYMTGGYFCPKITNINNPYNELHETINKVDLQDSIISTPLLYSRIDEYLFDLQQQINQSIFLLILLLIVEIIVTTFIVLNYLEREKIVNSIKLIHGYSFLKRHYKFMSIVTLTFIPMTLINIKLNIEYLKTIIIFIILYIILSNIFISLLIKIFENKKVKNVLKGE